MRSHDPRLAIALAILLALTLLPAAAPTDADSVERGEVTAPSTAEPSEPPEPSDPPDPERDIAVYRGLGTWLDMYNAGPYRHPEKRVRAMARQGVTTLYLQTANYQRPQDPSKSIFRYKIVSRIIEAAHRHDIAVVAWYLPSFKDVDYDYRRSRAAITFKTKHGERFDGFALDIESHLVDNIDRRNRRLRVLSQRLRKSVPADYALGAIVPEAGANYWPDFPYRMVAKHYDVFLPMAYHTFRISGYDRVVKYVRRNTRVIQKQTGDAAVPIHMIGGLASDIPRSETRAFVDSVMDHRVMGASLYDGPITQDDQWGQLRRITRERRKAPAHRPDSDTASNRLRRDGERPVPAAPAAARRQSPPKSRRAEQREGQSAPRSRPAPQSRPRSLRPRGR